jgi:hypothetical protein
VNVEPIRSNVVPVMRVTVHFAFASVVPPTLATRTVSPVANGLAALVMRINPPPLFAARAVANATAERYPPPLLTALDRAELRTTPVI